MNLLALIAFGLWALFMRYLPKILQIVKLKQWAENIPGPTVGEFIENAKKGEVLSWFIELRKKHGPTFRIWMGKDLTVFFSDPEDVKQLLSNNTLLYKSKTYRFAEPWLGKGLLTNAGESWHMRRKLLTPAFHFRVLSEFKEPLEENSKILVSKLREKANGEPFDIYPYLTLFALDAICETAMGIKKHAQMQAESEYVKAVQKICHIMHKQSFSFWQRFNIFFKFTQRARERDAAIKVLHDETNRVIRLRRKLLQESQLTNMNDAQGSQPLETEGQKRRLAFLDMLLISQMEGAPLSDREIREEVDTFMFEGHDTTSSAMGFAIYLLSQNAKEQQVAYEEAVALEGREKEAMPYLEAVIKETLRIYPSVPSYSRYVTENLNVGSLTVPKGVNVSILTYVVHRDEKCFPDPEKFDPTRFLPKESDANINPFSFVAFSAGPRNCIGQKFAMLELKCSLSQLLRNFEFLPVENYKPKPLAEMIMKSANGIQIRMKKR